MQIHNIKNKSKNSAPVNRWFLQRQDFFIRNIFKEFYQSYNQFSAVYKQRLDSGQIIFGDIEQLVGTEKSKGLWLLKDCCHQLWRDTGLQPGRHNSFFLDWLAGSIFHEAMKLKENIYIISRYIPLAREISELHGREAVTGNSIEWERFLASANQEIPKQMENLAFLFGRAIYLLREELFIQGENMLLLRYFFENQDIVKKLWSESLEEIFNDLFSGRPEQGYCLIGKSYLDGHWYEQSLAAYSSALKLNKKCDDALRRISQLRLISHHTEELMRAAS